MRLEILTDPYLDFVQHGFFTRRGGVSGGVYAGLNCGRGSQDEIAAVEENRNRVARAMNLAPNNLITLHQTHSADVVAIDDAGQAHGCRADAMVTANPGIGLGVLTADCQPVLFADPKAKIIGAAHAGWKGAKSGILQNTVAAMEALGAHRHDIVAVIGPSIGQDNYEVGPEFVAQFIELDADNAQYFKASHEDRALFDLVGYGLSQLDLAGVTNRSAIGHCTYADPARFFSYRRSVHQKEADYGRLLSVLRL